MLHCLEITQSEIPRSAPSKGTSFPRKRESNSPGAEVDPAFAGVTKVRLSFLRVGHRPMDTRNDSLEGFSAACRARRYARC